MVEIPACPSFSPNSVMLMVSEIFSALDTINIPLILFSFVFFFLGAYLLYAALFATVGSAVDSEADTQQFMLPRLWYR